MNTNEGRDVEAVAPIPTNPSPTPPTDGPPLRRQRSSIPSFLFISLVLFMLTNNRGDETVVRNQYQEAVEALKGHLGNYSAWLNGTSTNFTAVQLWNDSTTLPLAEALIPFGSQLDPFEASYYSNTTGFWKGDLQFYNLTALDNSTSDLINPPWKLLATQFMASANMSNATEVMERLGEWNWTASHKFTMSIRDKKVLPHGIFSNVSEDVAIIHGKIDLTDPSTEDEMRLEFDGVHFLSNGSFYSVAESIGRYADVRETSVLVPEHRLNETGHAIEAELSLRLSKLQEKLDAGGLEQDTPDEGPTSRCSFKFFGQLNSTRVPLYLMQELEEEIDNPTGVATIRPPEMVMSGVLVSKDCGILYEFKDTSGVKSKGLFRRITTYAGMATAVNLILLLLLSRQVARSRSAQGLARVSRYPFFLQSLIDAIAFVGHITMAVIADGRPSVSIIAPAGISCILFVYEAQFAVLIGQIQAPEDAIVPAAPTPPPTTAPSPQSTETNTPQANTPNPEEAVPTIAVTPPPAQPPPSPIPPEPPRTFFRFFIHHIRTDPGARLWAIMSFCLIVVFRVVVMLSLPLLFIGSMYAFMWAPQIYRSARRGRSSGLHVEYTVGVTLCRLFFLLYFLGCPKNILDAEPRSWIWGVALIMALTVGILALQEYLGSTFFLLGRVAQTQAYDYHPPMPLPDPEAPEQSLGDCSICMDAILVDPSLRQGGDDEKEQLLGLARWGQAASMRKSYSLAPCHHLFHTACLERWLAIKNICPQCRRPLPPL